MGDHRLMLSNERAWEIERFFLIFLIRQALLRIDYLPQWMSFAAPRWSTSYDCLLHFFTLNNLQASWMNKTTGDVYPRLVLCSTSVVVVLIEKNNAHQCNEIGSRFSLLTFHRELFTHHFSSSTTRREGYVVVGRVKRKMCLCVRVIESK